MTTVSTVYQRFSHHSAYSGYPRFTERLGAFVKAREVEPWRLPGPLLRRASSRVTYDWFGPDELRVDLTTARELVRRRGAIIHQLYGETHHFYAGRLRRIAHLRGNRLVVTFHQPPALIEELLPAPPLFEQIDHAIALGPRAAAHLAGVVGADRVSCAFHGADTDAWHPRPERRSPSPTCAFVGSWFRDFDVLAEVVALVRAREPAVRFEVVTEAGRVDELQALPGVRARCGISDEELREVYWSAWVHVLPLSDSVANNALLEGMACGLPTVVSDVGDVAAYTGEDGARLVPRGDAQAMAAAILELLGDRSLREQIGARARILAEARDLTAVARRHAQIYTSLLPSPPCA